MIPVHPSKGALPAAIYSEPQTKVPSHPTLPPQYFVEFVQLEKWFAQRLFPKQTVASVFDYFLIK
jgi:hypothetical protein